LLQAVDSSARDHRCGICTLQARREATNSPRRRQRMAALAERGKSLPLAPSTTGSRAGTTPQPFKQGKSYVVNPKFDIRVIGAPAAQYPYTQPQERLACGIHRRFGQQQRGASGVRVCAESIRQTAAIIGAGRWLAIERSETCCNRGHRCDGSRRCDGSHRDHRCRRERDSIYECRYGIHSVRKQPASKLLEQCVAASRQFADTKSRGIQRQGRRVASDRTENRADARLTFTGCPARLCCAGKYLCERHQTTADSIHPARRRSVLFH
jgi:hypothetical protein